MKHLGSFSDDSTTAAGSNILTSIGNYVSSYLTGQQNIQNAQTQASILQTEFPEILIGAGAIILLIYFLKKKK